MLLHVGIRLALRRGYSKHLAERFGFLPPSFKQNKAGSVWLHAVSVGEVSSLLPLIYLLRQRLPGAPIYLSTSTSAGRQIAEKQAGSLVDGLFFLPFDLGPCLRHTFRTVRPALLVIVETEVWPNLFATAHYSGTSLALINGRISDRTWPTYRKWQRMFHSLLRLPDLVQVQSLTDADRYGHLGVQVAALLVDANLKYDSVPREMPLDLPLFGAEHVWIAASTVGPNESGSLMKHSVDEDDLVLATFEKLAPDFPKLLLVIAPRQPARFSKVAAKLEFLGVSHTRRSANLKDLTLPGVLLLDTMGELARAYSSASVVFVGGSLAPRGGHNIIEPAAAGVPVVVGPYMHNFEAIARNFLEAGAMVQIKSSDELTPEISRLLSDPAEAQRLGRRGQALVQQQRGIAARTCERLVPLYHTGSFHRSHSLLAEGLLNSLAKLWMLGGNIKRRRGGKTAATQSPLPIPVISIGGLGVGGVGKTPFTITLGRILKAHGLNPGILTRGYRRRSSRTIVVAPGAILPVSETGDEVQIFLQTKIAPIGIGANRLETGRQLVNQFPETDILLLDDGFQHARIPRSKDIVLIDGLDPFGNGRIIPAGWLREPISSLERADLAVITRCHSNERYRAIADKILQYNPDITILKTETAAGSWRHALTDEVLLLPQSRKAMAFCGLGNPESFWSTLDSLPVAVVQRQTFRDHHRYSATDLQGLAKRAREHAADVLVTTQKDRFNLPQAPWPMQILYLPIELVVHDETLLLSRLLS